VAIDVGTGDGRYPLHLARTRPQSYALALDAASDGLRETARALTRRPLPNIVLLVGPVEDAGLKSLADEVTVHFPWGTLLSAVLGDAPLVLAAVASLAKVGACVRILVSATERDGRSPLTPRDLSGLSVRYGDAGLALRSIRRATRGDISEARSSWGKRLDAGGTRPAFVIEAVRR
jgi:16S rRNA (adenine(1408)-N(1))-methyltransferase